MQSRSAALRQEIESSLASRIPAALSPQAVQAPRLLPIGNEAVNTLLGGGLAIGGICEFTGHASAGRTSLALSLLSEATVDSACAYIDVSDSLDAESAAAAGVRLKNLLWVRFSEMRGKRPSLTPTAQAQNATAPSRGNASDRSTQHHGNRHPLTETKGIDRDLEKMLVQKAQTRLKKMEGTPGYRATTGRCTPRSARPTPSACFVSSRGRRWLRYLAITRTSSTILLFRLRSSAPAPSSAR
jgi:recombination protein RecA